MADVGEVRYKATVDSGTLDGEIKKVESKFGGLSGILSKTGSALKSVGSVGLTAIKGIGTAFLGLASSAGAGLAAIGKVGIEYNAQMQSYQTAFATMLGDAEKAQALTDNLKTLAAQTPLAMTDLADASQILLAFGSSAEELPDQLKRLGDVAQGDAQALGTMATAFGRVQSNGYASLEEINMMIDQGFNPLNIIAEQTGETMAEVRDRVSAGGVSFEELSNALQIATDEGGQFFNAMQNQSQTFEGQMSTLQDNAAALAGALTDDLFGTLAEKALPQVNEWVDTLLTTAQESGTEGVIAVSGTILTQALTTIIGAIPQFVETATSLISSFLGAVTDSGPEIIDTAMTAILSLISGFVDMIPELISTAGTLIENFLNGIADHLPEIISMAGRLISNLAGGLVDAAPGLISSAGNLISAFIDAFLHTDWAQIGIDIVSGIINGLGSMVGALINAAENIVNKALNSIRSALDSHSPSKKAAKLAKTVPQAFVQEFDRDDTVETAGARLGSRAIGSVSSGMKDTPQITDAAQNLAASVSATSRASAEITVPLYLDGREVARASAWYMGEQLSWEER